MEDGGNECGVLRVVEEEVGQQEEGKVVGLFLCRGGGRGKPTPEISFRGDIPWCW